MPPDDPPHCMAGVPLVIPAADGGGVDPVGRIGDRGSGLVVPAPRCGHAAGVNRLAVLATLAVVVVGVLTVVCAVFGPDWIVRHDLGAGGRSALPVGDRLKAVNDVRATLLQGLAAVVALGGVGLGAVMTLRQIRVHREGQFIDRFTEAIEQLSSDHVLMRMGGTYAMEQIADVAPHYRGHIAALLASFVRQQAPWPPSRPLQEVDVERRGYHGGLRDDIGGAMAALSRRAMVLPGTGIELEKVDLRGAELSGQDLSRFCFADSNLDDALLTGCDLSETTFAGASLRNADLTDATLTGADFTGAELEGAAGVSADLMRPTLAVDHDTAGTHGGAEPHP
jgi:hypothetical protein